MINAMNGGSFGHLVPPSPGYFFPTETGVGIKSKLQRLNTMGNPAVWTD